ncbi:30S ribosome-binding factor RbfA [Patescibacteria group bacterium]|nr:30S ribosome-binding factor RbfA [Patescibacteria group bacterium]
MSKRIQKVNELLKRELSQILLREAEFPQNTLVTITRVEASVDLREAKVFFSVIPESQIKEILQILNREIYKFQQKINKRLKMRPVPKIKFFKEIKTSEAARVEEILEKIKKFEKKI